MSNTGTVHSRSRYRRQSSAADEASWKYEQVKLHQYFAEQSRVLEDQIGDGKRPQAVIRQFFRDPKVKLAAVLKAHKGAINRDSAFEILDRVNPFSDMTYQVGTCELKTGTGASRTICKLPVELSAIHKMIKVALDAQLNRHSALFGVNGHGSASAAQRIHELQQDGFFDLWQMDVTRCFSSFNLDAIAQLPLPGRVKTYALDTRTGNMEFQAHNNIGERRGTHPGTATGQRLGSDSYLRGNCHIRNARGPEGLMQGSPASSAIMAWFLNETLHRLPNCSETQVLICFDNVVVASRNPVECRMIRNTLADSLGRCSFGPLMLHDIDPSDPELGLDFLGYNFAPDGNGIGISSNSKTKLEGRLNRIEKWFEAERGEHRAEEATLFVWQALRGFAFGFSATSNVEEELAPYIAHSEWIARATGSYLFTHLHNNILAPSDTLEGQIINERLKNRRSFDRQKEQSMKP